MKDPHPVLRLLNAPRPPVGIDFDPAWRWNRARTLAKIATHVPRRFRRTTPLIYYAFHYCRQHMDRGGPPEDREQLAGTYPRIDGAFQLFHNPTALQSRQVLEALLLSDEDLSRVAERVQIHPRVVDAYAHLFFDVRDLLTNRFFVSSNVLGPLLDGGGVKDRGSLFKLLVLAGGADMLQRYLDMATDFTPDQWTCLIKIIRRRIATNAITAAAAVKPSQQNAIPLQNLHRQVEEGMRAGEIEISRLKPAASAAQTEVEELTGGIIRILYERFGKNPVRPMPTAEQMADEGNYIELGLAETIRKSIEKSEAVAVASEPPPADDTTPDA
ncbi:MAG TPA: hypothetical protein VJZ71_20475 [Phycisphaerae bacterium]|nr:hypothetical protein [Phycisphaerae bacterium]